jgi:hypothetical protein
MNCSHREFSLLVAFLAFPFALFPIIGSAQNPAPAQTMGPVLVAKIVGNISTRNAKAGDIISAKTLKPWKLKDGTDIPKGSKLVGKVASARSKQAGNGNSLLTFRFDQAELKGGASIPLHALVVAIGPGLGPKEDAGANSVLGRGGVGSDPGLDPRIGLGRPGAKDEDDIPLGSSLEGVGLGHHLDADWTTALQGIHRDIQLDSDVLIKVEFK